MKARRRRPNPCRDLERLERRELLSQGATPVLGGDPFANSTTDNPAAQTGMLYPDSQVEPDIVVNPTRPNNVVALWQQDRWSNGGARGIVVAVSSNGGNHWIQVVLPGVSKVSGGKYDRVSNAWMSFAPDGTLYVSTIAFNLDPNYPDPFNTNGSAVYVSKSTDGGYTWSAPTTIINDPNPDVAPNGDPELVFNDKDTVTADPTRPGFVYVVWDRTVEDLATRAFTGPAYFSMTTDGGRTWSTPEAIYTPPVGADPGQPDRRPAQRHAGGHVQRGDARRRVGRRDPLHRPRPHLVGPDRDHPERRPGADRRPGYRRRGPFGQRDPRHRGRPADRGAVRGHAATV